MEKQTVMCSSKNEEVKVINHPVILISSLKYKHPAIMTMMVR